MSFFRYRYFIATQRASVVKQTPSFVFPALRPQKQISAFEGETDPAILARILAETALALDDEIGFDWFTRHSREVLQITVHGLQVPIPRLYLSFELNRFPTPSFLFPNKHENEDVVVNAAELLSASVAYWDSQVPDVIKSLRW